MRYWHKTEAPKAKQGSWHSPHSTKAIDTEMTSYVLLTYALKADKVGGKGIMQWVAQQRNPNGGFTSTQVISIKQKLRAHTFDQSILSKHEFLKSIFIIEVI